MGEFRKRIEALIVPQEHNGYNDGFWVSEPDTERFWELFEEARREYPKWKKEFELNELQDYASDCYQWFVKWFVNDQEQG